MQIQCRVGKIWKIRTYPPFFNQLSERRRLLIIRTYTPITLHRFLQEHTRHALEARRREWLRGVERARVFGVEEFVPAMDELGNGTHSEYGLARVLDALVRNCENLVFGEAVRAFRCRNRTSANYSLGYEQHKGC